MIFYFSGTGNSSFVATTLANFLGMKKCFIPELNPTEVAQPEDNIIFVFPVYSWGVPPLVSQFIKNLPSTYWDQAKAQGLQVNCVMTCGDEVALSPEMITKDLKRVGIIVNSIWSVIMPNNYVLLPGFDVDSKSLENSKLDACQSRIIEIATSLSKGEKRLDVTRGNLAWLKSKIVFPLFKRWGIFPRKWHFATNCISCGKCEKICPLFNVKMVEGHPQWGKNCCSCLACYHVCPVHAIEYGKETIKKGQYLFPLKRISSQNYHK